MKQFWAILERFIPPYKKYMFANIFFNILAALFTVFSFGMLIPVLNILFEIEKEVVELQEFSFKFDILKNNLYYYVSLAKNHYGQELTLLLVGCFYILATLLKVGFTFLASYYIIYIRNGIVRDIRNQIYTKIIMLPLSFFSEERKGDIMARMTGDVTEVENSVMNSLDMLIKNPIMILVCVFTMFFMNWQLTLFVFVLLPISGFIIGRVGKSLKQHSMEGQNKMGELLSTTEETLTGHRIIKAFNAEEKMEERFDEENNTYRRIMNRLMRRRSLAHPMSEFLGSITIIFLLGYGGSIIFKQETSFDAPAFITFLGLFYSIINPAKALSSAAYSIQKGLASMDRIDTILNAKSSIEEVDNPHDYTTFSDCIQYQNLSFSYDGKKEVLHDINVTIKKGETIALVGHSGSGKTTFADLLPRFYDATNGQILVDDTNIKYASLKSLRNLMGNVNQDPILFNDTVFNNIAFGMEDATLDEVIEAAKIANAHEFISQMREGYQTNIGDGGGRLSGGQRQRLSIARAVLKNPPIMILDEATSALDTQSEKLVQEALENLMEDRTSIVIAHRLSTIQKADRIYVFKDGEIVETGKHKELIELNGLYKELNQMQSLGQE